MSGLTHRCIQPRRASRLSKIATSALGLLVLFLAYELGDWTGCWHARTGSCLIVARDTTDSQQPTGKTEYEPYFTEQNRIPDWAE